MSTIFAPNAPAMSAFSCKNFNQHHKSKGYTILNPKAQLESLGLAR